MLRELGCVMWREEVRPFEPPPSLNAICRGGSPLPSPPAPGAYAPLAGAGCGAPREPWAFCAPPQRPGPPSCLCSGMVGHIGVVWWWWWWWWWWW